MLSHSPSRSRRPIQAILRFIKLNSLIFNRYEQSKIITFFAQNSEILKSKKLSNELKVTLFYFFFIQSIYKSSLARRECLLTTLERTMGRSKLIKNNTTIDSKLLNHLSPYRYRCIDCKIKYLCHNCYLLGHKDHKIEALDLGIFDCEDTYPHTPSPIILALNPSIEKGRLPVGIRLEKDGILLEKNPRKLKLKNNKMTTYKLLTPLLDTLSIGLLGNEKIIAKIGLKILSGGLEDGITFGLANGLKTDPRGIQLAGYDLNTLGYCSSNGVLRSNWNSKFNTSLPRTGAGDILEFWLSNHKKIYFLINKKVFCTIPDCLSKGEIFCWVSLKGIYTEVELLNDLTVHKFQTREDSLNDRLMSFRLKKFEKNEIRNFFKKMNFSNIEYLKRIKMMIGIEDLSTIKESKLSSSTFLKKSKTEKFNFQKNSKNLKKNSDILPTDYDIAQKTTERDLITHRDLQEDIHEDQKNTMITANCQNPLDMSRLSIKSENKNQKKANSDNEDYRFTFSCFCIKFSGKRRT